MKRFTFVLVTLLCMVFTSRAQNNVGINDNNSSPNAAAMLDVNSTSKGMLIPRVSLQSSTDVTTIASPVASLLVYNTATVSDVLPGYYYYNSSSKWVRLAASGDPVINFNLVEKSANDTLLITENTILASGDITLTLPAITSANEGLSISIKNVGTCTDLITIVGGAGVKIDNSNTLTLTRWKGRTLIARGTSWFVKEKETRIDNRLEVSESGSFQTIAEVMVFLNEHMFGPTTAELGAGTYNIAATQIINLPYPVTFQGIAFGETFITGTAGASGTPLFSCTTESYFKQIVFNAYANTAGNDAIRFTGSRTYNEVKDCHFIGFNKGIASTNNNDIWVFESDFVNCAAAGIEIAAGTASGGSIQVSTCNFRQCTKGIHLLSGVAENVSFTTNGFYNTTSGTDIGVLYVPATFTSFITLFIKNNTWNAQGTYLSGFDFSRPDGRDADAYQEDNAGIENENPHCKLDVINNATTTTVTTAGTYYKANWTNAAGSFTCKWTLADNRITYQPTNKRDAWAIISGTVIANNSNRVFTIGIVKNGVITTRYGETIIRFTTSNRPFTFTSVIYIPDMAKNDYMELYVTSDTNGDIITFQDIQWFTNTQ